MGRHHGGRDDMAEGYGRHSPINAGGLTVAALIERVARAGHAVRLAWRGREAADVADWSDEFPTAVLPMAQDRIKHQAEPDSSSSDDQETEPTTATQEARRWLRGSSNCRKYLTLKVQKKAVFTIILDMLNKHAHLAGSGTPVATFAPLRWRELWVLPWLNSGPHISRYSYACPFGCQAQVFDMSRSDLRTDVSGYHTSGMAATHQT
jgi:hypothetical protein